MYCFVEICVLKIMYKMARLIVVIGLLFIMIVYVHNKSCIIVPSDLFRPESCSSLNPHLFRLAVAKKKGGRYISGRDIVSRVGRLKAKEKEDRKRTEYRSRVVHRDE